MIVGNICKTNIYPNLFMSIRPPKRKLLPAFVQSSTATKHLPNTSKTVWTAGNIRTDIPIMNCRARALKTVPHCTFLRSRLKIHAMKIITAMPTRPLSMERMLKAKCLSPRIALYGFSAGTPAAASSTVLSGCNRAALSAIAPTVSA